MKEPKLVSIFPYQIKDVNKFYDRNHPKNLHPHSSPFQKYWKRFRTKCVEGHWVNDGGTWVFMMPKLFFYTNYTKISVGEQRVFEEPRLRDNEWIMASYFLCVDGFSGFEEDYEYTCHDFIRRIEECADPKFPELLRDPLNDIELTQIPVSCFKSDGSYKKYVDPWHYLTHFYLIENPVGRPLGQALYENTRHNGMMLTARGIGKSYFTFVGDFLHEWLFNGIHRIADIHRVNDKLLFGMGASDKDFIDRSLANVSTLYDRLPGGYRYSDAKKQRYMGAFYKRIKGSWRSDAETTHSVKYKSGTRDFIDSSTLYVAVLTRDKTKIGAGDRFRRVYIEEVGFLEYLFDVHSANRDSMIAEGVKVGSAIYTGTGGSMEKVREAKKMFDTVKAYDIFGIPNYWENINKKIGLFIPAHYVDKKYKDNNGNTKLELAHRALLKQREEDRIDLDSRSFEERISFNPMEPKEILKANSGGILPRKECQDQLSDLDTYDIWRKKAQIGSFKFNPVDPRGVEWVKDMDRLLHPILDMEHDTSASNKDGAWVVYEQPPDYIPDGLYWVIYDPAKNEDDGESYHSILVYKSFYVGDEKSLYDTLVAELICRRQPLDPNYQEVIKAAKYFNAKIFPETNVIGFVNWCKNNGFYNMLEGDAAWVEEQASPGSKRNYYRVGIEMTDRKKQWAMKALRDYLLSIKEHDPHTGAPMIRTLDWIFSKRLLSEIINYEDGLNFDHVSSMLCLMFLREKLHGTPPAELKSDDEFEETSDMRYIRLQLEAAITAERTSRRRKFVDY